MKTSILTINSIGHGLQEKSIISIGNKLYKILSFDSDHQFQLRQLMFYEVWLYDMKCYFREISRYCKKFVDNINI